MSQFKINSGNKNPNKGKGNAGRKIGSRNKLTPTAKAILKEALQNDFKRLDKLISYIPFDKRFVALKSYAKLLSTGGDDVSLEVKEIIFNSLESEFKKLPIYLRQLSADERAKQLRFYLRMLDKNHIEEIFKGIYKSE